jgi:dUTP pyrophosphatase
MEFIRTVLGNIPVAIWTEFNHTFGLPKYETAGSSGLDVRANKDVVIFPNCTNLVPTGIFVALPEDYEIQVRPRSGLSLKTSLRVANSPGSVDSDFRGELCIIVHNIHNKENLEISLGDRIAQIVLAKVPKIEWKSVSSKDELEQSMRGENGFGSTGIN